MELEGALVTELAVWLLEWGREHLLVLGHVENWVILLDMADVWSTGLPTEQLQHLLGVMQTLYRARLYRLFVVNMPLLAYAVWKLASSFLSAYTLANVDV